MPKFYITTPIYLRRLWRLCVLAALIVGLTGLALATDQGNAVDAYIRSEMAKQHVPGLALMVSRGGQVIRAQAYGLANVELPVPVKRETVFESGSVGKQFTATAIMMLMEEGKIGLEDPLTKYFSDAPPTWRQNTIRELLSHTAGIPDYPKDFDLRKDYTEEELIQIIEKMPLDYAPGADWSYSNLGYVTLGVVIHKVTGKFYGDFLQERIFRPLGMNTARVISDTEIIPNRAAGYRMVQGELKNQEWVSPSLNTVADGSLYFPVLDLAKWDTALYTEKVLKQASLEQMWSIVKLKNGQANSGKYGFGWFIETKKGHRVVGHEGESNGFKAQLSRYVDDKLTVVVLTNLLDVDPTALADHVAEIYLAGQAK